MSVLIDTDYAYNSQYYDDHALLLDEEMTNVLAMLVVGLETTLFSIEIDNPDLNTVKYAAAIPEKQSSMLSSSPPLTVRSF